MFDSKKLRKRIEELEKENAELSERARHALQVLDMLDHENIFIYDMSAASGAGAGNHLYYVNAHAKRAIQERRQDLKRELGIDADRMIGSSMHAFYKDPERGRQIIARLRAGEPHVETEISLGRHTFPSVSHALTSREGKMVGVVTAWSAIPDHPIEPVERARVGEISQLAAAMEEMTVTTEEVARNTRQASDMSSEAMQHAETGGEVMSQLVTGMTGIGETVTASAEAIKKLGQRSNEIGKIIEVINDIADQTNMLALNAAIEAARAGEQGRGFAVVADEVRKLSERTTKATKEIGITIKATQGETESAVTAMMRGTQDVERGKKLVTQVSEALSSILADSKKVTDLMMHIASATEEQSRTVQEISENVEKLAKV
jgi:hypothetical protein